MLFIGFSDGVHIIYQFGNRACVSAPKDCSLNSSPSDSCRVVVGQECWGCSWCSWHSKVVWWSEWRSRRAHSCWQLSSFPRLLSAAVCRTQTADLFFRLKCVSLCGTSISLPFFWVPWWGHPCLSLSRENRVSSTVPEKHRVFSSFIEVLSHSASYGPRSPYCWCIISGFSELGRYSGRSRPREWVFRCLPHSLLS